MADNARGRSPESQRWLQFILVSYIIVAAWFFFSPKPPQPKPGSTAGSTTTSTLTATSDPGTSGVAGAATVAEAKPEAAPTVEGTSVTLQPHPGPLVSARTAMYALDFDLVGAVVNSWRLLRPGSNSYKETDETSRGIEMVRRIPGLEGGQAAQQMWPLEVTFKEANARSYEDFNHVAWSALPLSSSAADTTVVRLASPSIRGLRLEKSFDLPKDKYYSTFRLTVYNETSSTVPIIDENNRGLTLRWGPGLLERGTAELNSGDAIYDTATVRGTGGVRVFRPSPKPGAEAMEVDDQIEWAGVESKFFAALLVPAQPDDAARKQRYFFRTLVPEAHKIDPTRASSEFRRGELEKYHAPLSMELITENFELKPHSSRTFEFGVYLGPKKHAVLKGYPNSLQSVVFSESWWWMRMIYLGLTDLLNWLYVHVIRDYGIAIMLLTVIVKIAVFPLVHRSIKMQAKTSYEMKRIKPHLEAIQERYKDDPQAKSRETWKVYQEHGINPLGAMRSCIPVLPQMPIFIGLYKVANDTIDLQGAQFLWIKDLSQADHLFHMGFSIPFIGAYFNLLPLIVGFTQMISSKLAMQRMIQTITDPMQRQLQQQMVYLIPIMVTVTMFTFPAGLMLYWMASNTWQILQTLITNKILDYEEAQHAKKGPPPPREPKEKNPNSFFGKMMARAEQAKEEFDRQQKEIQKQQRKKK
ncbi:MAG: membrane protein insertase YidC [Candidatus Sumerlaeaceae bacterium]